MDIADYKRLLSQFISFKSVSADSASESEIRNCTVWLKNLFERNGFEVEVWKGDRSNPVVFASYSPGGQSELGTKTETVLVYGHYDVQPACAEASVDKSGSKHAWLKAGWRGDPFKLREIDGRLIGRGAIDNKGQILIHMVAIFDLIEQGKLAQNVKFVIEGDEEAEGGMLRSKIQDARYKRKLAADYVLISDGELDEERPALEVSLRGGFNCTLRLETAENDLHSGQHGGAARNAAAELAKVLAVAEFPEFRKAVDSISSEQQKTLSDFQVRTGLLPTIQVTGVRAGYVGEGYANIIPGRAEVRLNFRLVCSQKPEEIFERFSMYIQTIVPKGVKVSLEAQGFHDPVKLNLDFPKVVQVKQLLAQVYGREVIHKPVGGAVPVVLDLQKYVQKRILLVPLGNVDGNMHGAEENFRIDLIDRGLSFSRRLFSV